MKTEELKRAPLAQSDASGEAAMEYAQKIVSQLHSENATMAETIAGLLVQRNALADALETVRGVLGPRLDTRIQVEAALRLAGRLQ